MPNGNKQRSRLYLAGFLIALNSALPAYLFSSFLGAATSEQAVGLIYTMASAIGVIVLYFTPYWIHHSRRRFTLTSLTAALLAGLALALSVEPATIVTAFIVYYVTGFALHYLADLELEQVSRDAATGTIRGWFLTILSLAWLISPLLAAALMTRGGYALVFAVAALVNLPLFWLLWGTGVPAAAAAGAPAAAPLHDSPLAALKLLIKEKRLDLSRILAIDFLLQFFYAVMVIYTPLYLYNHLGLSWEAIGVIFTWMLLPFVILDYPLGRIADKYLGEKEILTIALGLMVLATAAASFIGNASVVVWAVVLFATRTGAAALEDMKEVYLFKNISGVDADILSLSRNLVPLSYIVAPLLATTFLFFFPLKFIFLALAIILCLGFYPALKLRDTK